MHAFQHIDHRRQSLALAIPAEKKAELGQYMTPSVVADFMAGLFSPLQGRDIRLLDAGAGIGSLTVAFVARAEREGANALRCLAWEIDPVMRSHLQETLAACAEVCEGSLPAFFAQMRSDDFVLAGPDGIRYGETAKFTHAILNPPYKKLRTDSPQRRALRKVGIETSNHYAAFVALALLMLEDGGELVAITPRSFCNGTYFKAFRKMLFELAALRQVHVFEARDKAFQGDAVLQENVVFRLVKGGEQRDVVLSVSSDSSFEDFRQKRLDFTEVVQPGDAEQIIHLPTDAEDELMNALLRRFTCSLDEIGIAVSTGPVVDFRLREHLRPALVPGCVPLIYCLHFSDGFIAHPKPSKKANALAVNEATAKWLMPSGHYVCVRRLSSKEEKQRIVPALFDPQRVVCEQVGFDNHMNVFHEAKHGMSPLLARGLAVYLGSSFVDRWFRRFNGHTQVNAGDLRALKYPDRQTLEAWGALFGDVFPSRDELDRLVNGGG